jgi:2-oxo-3-(phosphooxy)propyl 3-oxoalkanoate synthase
MLVTPQQQLSLRWDRTIARNLVHRDSIHEVFVVDYAWNDPHMRVAVQVPASHAFYGVDAGRRRDVTLLTEVLRQACLAAAHAGIGVDLGDRFLLDHVEIALSARPEEYAYERPRPANMTVTVKARSNRNRAGRVQSVDFEATVTECLFGADLQVGSGSLRARVVSSMVYARMVNARKRAFSLDTPSTSDVGPGAVGRFHDYDVLLTGIVKSAHSVRAQLRSDPTHPVLIEHDTDHVPGLMLVEAARQAACLMGIATEGDACVHATFAAMVALDRLKTVCALREGTGAVVTIHEETLAATIRFCGGRCDVGVGGRGAW